MQGLRWIALPRRGPGRTRRVARTMAGHYRCALRRFAAPRRTDTCAAADDDARAGDVTRVLERNGMLGGYTPAVNYLGLPALSLPLGGTVGLQVIGRAGGDAGLLHAGAAIARSASDHVQLALPATRSM